MSKKYLSNLFSENIEYRFTKTNNRSVLGSMNDFKNQIKVQIKHKGELKYRHDLINHLINEVPMRYLKYNQPKNRMREELFTKQKIK